MLLAAPWARGMAAQASSGPGSLSLDAGSSKTACPRSRRPCWALGLCCCSGSSKNLRVCGCRLAFLKRMQEAAGVHADGAVHGAGGAGQLLPGGRAAAPPPLHRARLPQRVPVPHGASMNFVEEFALEVFTRKRSLCRQSIVHGFLAEFLSRMVRQPHTGSHQRSAEVYTFRLNERQCRPSTVHGFLDECLHARCATDSGE